MSPRKLERDARGFATHATNVQALAAIPKDLAAAAMRIIATWSHIELVRTRLLTAALRSDFIAVQGMFDAVTSPTARQAALNTVLERVLLPEDHQFFRQLWKCEVAPAEKIRNRYAHGILGICVSDQDCIVVENQRDSALQEAAWEEFTARIFEGVAVSNLIRSDADAEAAQAITAGWKRGPREFAVNAATDNATAFNRLDLEHELAVMIRAHHAAFALYLLVRHGDERARKLLLAKLPDSPAVRLRYPQSTPPSPPPPPGEGPTPGS